MRTIKAAILACAIMALTAGVAQAVYVGQLADSYPTGTPLFGFQPFQAAVSSGVSVPIGGQITVIDGAQAQAVTIGGLASGILPGSTGFWGPSGTVESTTIPWNAGDVVATGNVAGSVLPSMVPSTGGQVVSILGNFPTSETASINGINLPTTWPPGQDDPQVSAIDVTIPPASVLGVSPTSSVTVNVSGPGGANGVTPPISYYVPTNTPPVSIPGPTISSASIATGVTGQTLTITGADFAAEHTVVNFGPNAYAPATVNSAGTTATVTVPAGTPGSTVALSVADMAGTSPTTIPFRYLWTPSITSASVSSGYGGQTLTITGGNFAAEHTTVNFGSSLYATATVNAAGTTATVTIPSDTPGTVVALTVATIMGTSPTSIPFTYLWPPPTVSSYTPTADYSFGGAVLTINGTNFSPSVLISICGQTAAPLIYSTTQLQTVIPANTAPSECTIQVSEQNSGEAAVAVTVGYFSWEAFVLPSVTAPIAPATPAPPPAPSPPAGPANAGLLAGAQQVPECTGTTACAASHNPVIGSNSCHFPWTACHADLWRSVSVSVADYFHTHLVNAASQVGTACAVIALVTGVGAAICGVTFVGFGGELAASAATIYSNGSGCISIQYSYLPTELSGGGLPPVPYNITVDGGSGCR